MPRSTLVKPRLPFAAVIAATLLMAACGGSPPPDVILITVDTLRPDHLGAYGHAGARTPNMDRLADRGLRFTQATTPMPRTTPAIASLFTGLWPRHHGSLEVGTPMRELPTLAGTLGEGGYVTVGISSTEVLGPDQGIDRGFDRFMMDAMHARQVTDEALRRVAEVPTGGPLFLWVHYFDPHFPYVPWPGWEDVPDGGRCNELLVGLTMDRTIAWADIQMDRDGISSRALADCAGMYDAEIAFVDHEIGRLLEGLHGRGRGEPVIVLTADHGENLGEAGLFFEHGPNVHDASLRVPLILAGPGITPRTDDGIARLEDLMPTLLGLLEIPASRRPPMDGLDLLGPGPRPEAAFAESGTSLYPRYTAQLATGRRGGPACVHGERFSLCGDGGRASRLYDHTADPGFRHDIAAAHPAEVARLAEAWGRWPPETARERTVRTPRFKLVQHPLLDGGYDAVLHDLVADPAEARDAGPANAEDLDRLRALLAGWVAAFPAADPDHRSPEELERLRSLGYVN